MHLRATISISTFAVLGLVAGCAGSPPAQSPEGTGGLPGGDGTSPNAASSAASPRAAGATGSVSAPQDAGPTTTTTLTMGDGGNLTGAKLVTRGDQSYEVSVDSGVKNTHQPDVGRGTKDIQAIIVARRDDARACYDNALASHPGIEGNLDIKWTIDPKGVVTDIAVDSSRSDILEPSVANCVIAIIKKIHFNESAKGFETYTHYPFNFHPRPGGPARHDAGS
jgi:hypothetical protein